MTVARRGTTHHHEANTHTQQRIFHWEDCKCKAADTQESRREFLSRGFSKTYDIVFIMARAADDCNEGKGDVTSRSQGQMGGTEYFSSYHSICDNLTSHAGWG